MFTKDDGPTIIAAGEKMAKKRNPVYLVKPAKEECNADGTFTVRTNEGVVNGKPGDWLAHDPISGHVWPVSAEYVAQHYEPF